MKRRDFFMMIGGAAALALPPSGPTARKNPRGGGLWAGARGEEEAVYLGALREGLTDLGYIEGRNIVLENRFPAEKWERFISLATELVQLKPDLLVAMSRPAAIAAQ